MTHVDLTNSSMVWYATCLVLLGEMVTETLPCTSASDLGPWTTVQYTSEDGATMLYRPTYLLSPRAGRGLGAWRNLFAQFGLASALVGAGAVLRIRDLLAAVPVRSRRPCHEAALRRQVDRGLWICSETRVHGFTPVRQNASRRRI